MGGLDQPFLYNAIRANDARFPEEVFDPKAITRQSWEVKPAKPIPKGPLLKFNQHPDAMAPIEYRNRIMKPIGKRTTKWIIGLRWALFSLRILQAMTATAVFVLMILIVNVEKVTGWMMRISSGVIAAHAVYGAYHVFRPPGARPPASSSAYQLFSAIADFCALPLYGFGAIAAKKYADEWGTRLENKDTVSYLIPAVFYLALCGGCLHLITMNMAMWLGWKFRQITLLPPDLNPFETNLTSRPVRERRQHKKNNVSMGTTLTNDSERTLTVEGESPRKMKFVSAYSLVEDDSDELIRPTSIPFQHTRANSLETLTTLSPVTPSTPSRYHQKRDSRPGTVATNSRSSGLYDEYRRHHHGNSSISTYHQNSSQRDVVTSSFTPGSPLKGQQNANSDDDDEGEADHRRMSPSPAKRVSYTRLARHEQPTSHKARRVRSQDMHASDEEFHNDEDDDQNGVMYEMGATGATSKGPAAGGKGKFTETWFATDSLIGRTQRHLNKAMEQRQQQKQQQQQQQQYANDRVSLEKASISSLRRNPNHRHTLYESLNGDAAYHGDDGASYYSVGSGRDHAPVRASSPPLQSVDNDARIKVQKNRQTCPPESFQGKIRKTSDSHDLGETPLTIPRRRPRDGNSGQMPSSPEKENGQPYQQVPPSILPSAQNRQVSSGNDYHEARTGTGRFGLRHVSGKAAEEGMAGSYARYLR